MKKYLLLLIAALAISFASCSDDEKVIIPTLADVSILNGDDVTELYNGETLTLNAQYSSNVDPTIAWEVNDVVVSREATFVFSPKEPDIYTIKLTVATEVETISTTLSVKVLGAYSEGTFVLNEGNFGNPPSSLIYISPNNELTEEAYFKVNNTHLGGASQDLYIAHGKMYIISQNGGEDGMLVIANAGSLKKQLSFSKEQLSTLNWPTHVAVTNKESVYIRDNNGVYLFNPTTATTTFIEGTKGALKNRMAVAGGKVFVGGSKSVMVLEEGKLIYTIPLAVSPTGVIKASDNNIWVSTNGTPAAIMKISSTDYSITKTNELGEYKISAGWGATPGISAKGDILYFGNAGTNIYSHNFATGETKEQAKVKEYIENAGMAYNNLAVNPKTGDVYVTTIKGYGTNYLVNNISVFNFETVKESPLVTTYQDYTRFPAGIFFSYDFE